MVQYPLVSLRFYLHCQIPELIFNFFYYMEYKPKNFWNTTLRELFSSLKPHFSREDVSQLKKDVYLSCIALFFGMAFVQVFEVKNITQFVTTNFINPQVLIKPLLKKAEANHEYEIFGFAPFWTLDNMESVDFTVLTTLAYFGIPVLEDGSLDTSYPGYTAFHSKQATDLFTKAHSHGTHVVLTLTQMNNSIIKGLMDDPTAQEKAIASAVAEVKERGIDGINVDFEYTGNPGEDYRNKFTTFVSNLSRKLKEELPYSRITVSVYASSVREPKIYNIKSLAEVTDGIFMMAYDFATYSADYAMPTAPLYGYKEGKYWYDIATAVDDFLGLMNPDKLILGLPWYGYNYLVYTPEVNAETRPYYSWRGKPRVQTYAIAQNHVTPEMQGIDEFITGWDDHGKVTWKAYHVEETDTWRMLFIDDKKSLSLKYDFAKEKQLKGVGMWALGFEDTNAELWAVLEEKFGKKLAFSNN